MRPGSELNAWCDYPEIDVPHASEGPLAGLTLAVKDIYQVAGYPNGWGTPTRLAEAEPDIETQSVVQKMCDAGAKILGKSQCEELCFSMNGVNIHYGAPHNSAAPDRVTGGSSSGSVSLMAAGAVDLATGSDTGGSVRAPASYCGLIGLRTTHGRISLDQTMALARSFDCFGWYAQDAEIYQKVGRIVMDDDPDDTPLDRLIATPDLDSLVLGDLEYREFTKAGEQVEKVLDQERDYFSLDLDIEKAYWAFRVCQAFESWQELGPWITKTQPDLGPGIKDRFEYGSKLTREDFDKSNTYRGVVTRRMEELLGTDGLLIYPTVPSCAPLKSNSDDELQVFREKALKLLCFSGLSGLPQISLPMATVHGAPFGLSLMGPRNSDQRLIALARKILEGTQNS